MSSPTLHRPHIALLSPGPPHIGGVERNMLQLIDRLGDRFTFSVMGPEPSPEFHSSLESLAYPVEVIQLRSTGVLDLRDIPAIALVLRRTRPEIIHTQNPRGRFLSFPIARALGIRTVNTFNMSPLIYGNKPLKQKGFLALEGMYSRRFSDGLIFVSSHLRDLYERHDLLGNTPVTLIHNGLDIGLLTPLLAQRKQFRQALGNDLGVPLDTVLVAGVGRLHRQKGFDFLIDALGRLLDSDANQDFHVALVGDGDQRAALEAQARRLGIERHLSFLGWRDQTKVHQILIGSDLLVLPSRFECFPYTLLEATAAGLPAVTTDVGGNAEIVLHERNGLVVSPNDVPALAAALGRLIQDSKLREIFRTNALVDANRFTVDQMAEQTAAFYEHVLNS